MNFTESESNMNSLVSKDKQDQDASAEALGEEAKEEAEGREPGITSGV